MCDDETSSHSIATEMRGLTEQELAVVGGATAWDGAKAAAGLMAKTAAMGAAILIGVTNSAVRAVTEQT